MIGALFRLSFSYTERAVPAYWINNWDSKNPIIATWNAASDSWTIDPTHYPGIQSIRAFDHLETPIMDVDSFAFKVDNKVYENPKLYNSSHLGGCVKETDGELWTEYTHYGKDALPISIRKSFYMLPHSQYYLVKYIIQSMDNKKHVVELLDFVNSSAATSVSCDDNQCTYDHIGDAVSSVIHGSDSETPSRPIVGLSDNQETNPLSQFITGNYDHSKTCDGSVTTAFLYQNLNIQPLKPVTIYAFRAFGRTKAEAEKVMAKASAIGYETVLRQTALEYSEFLERGIRPKLSGEYLALFDKSILMLKDSINPKLGTIASSLHYKYEYKNWARDSLMAAFMMDAAGYHDEAKAFYDWLPTAPRDDNNGWFTTYNVFDGAHVPFVEPQYDAMGLFPIAINYHFRNFGDTQFVRSHLPMIEECAEFMMKRGKHGLGLPDYAPWEESSDHHINNIFWEVKYNTFTQGLYYGGLIACARLEEALGEREKAVRYRSRAAELKALVEEYMWDESSEHYLRSRWSTSFEEQTIAESATLSIIFTGLADRERSLKHREFIVSKLEHLGGGISRYEHDPYFFDSQWNPCGNGTRETQVDEPVWPVTTAYMCWAEEALGIDYQKRLDWMVKYSAFGSMPTGECVDRADGALVLPSSPDGFEHGGVYVFTTLLKQGLARSILSTLQ